MTIAACATSANAGAEQAVESCALQSGGYRTVTRIIDAETIALDDGREVRLIGALAPRASDAGAVAGSWPIETEAVRALTAMVLGRTVKIAFGGRRADRYGRLLAHVFVGEGNAESWVQGQMIAAGAARAYGLPGSYACSMELLAHERVARLQRRGVWSIGLYRIKSADQTAALLQQRSRFEIVIGKLATVSRTKSATYVNFGADWKSDFTARIAKDVLTAHPAFAQSLDTLVGRRIAVRGWIERRNGPMIDIRDPSQIEVLDMPDGSPALSSIYPLDDDGARMPANVITTEPSDGPSDDPSDGSGVVAPGPSAPRLSAPDLSVPNLSVPNLSVPGETPTTDQTAPEMDDVPAGGNAAGAAHDAPSERKRPTDPSRIKPGAVDL